MKPRISVLTLSVSDLEKAAAFYRDGLGFKTEGIVDASSSTVRSPSSWITAFASHSGHGQASLLT
jgi:catechol 2,3-dioxygenase-like lactoylglutathione lyase family enzyme